MSEQTWHFSALDSLFFRESRPMESVGGSELSSIFPPPARTLAGAMRTTLAETSTEGVDWKAYASDTNHPLRQVIGYGDDMGPLCIKGVWLNHNGERLYPAPGNLVGKRADKEKNRITITKFMSLSEATQCDLGNGVRFSTLPEGFEGAKPLSGSFWLTSSGFQALLKGEEPASNQLMEQSEGVVEDLYITDPRVGIARDNNLHVVKKGLLYQTRHIRLKENISIEVEATGLPEQQSGSHPLVRLGGEGRLAGVKINNKPAHFISAPEADNNTLGLILYLLSPAQFNTPPDVYEPLPGFIKNDEGGTTIWQGSINSIPLTLHSVVAGKAHREGGWDMAQHKPRPVKSLVPAGSAYYCTVDDHATLSDAITALHGVQIGEEQALGRGKIAAGLWLKNS